MYCIGPNICCTIQPLFIKQFESLEVQTFYSFLRFVGFRLSGCYFLSFIDLKVAVFHGILIWEVKHSFYKHGCNRNLASEDLLCQRYEFL